MAKKKTHRLPQKWYKRLLGLAVAFIFFMGIGLTGVYVTYSKDLPSDNEIVNWHTDEATRIYDRHGNLLYEIHGDEKRITVSSEQISEYLKEATIAIEDARFYRHWGLDPKGIIRAAWKNIQAKAYIEGGSTITQQLAKNAFLNPQRSYDRKLREAFLALKIEQRYTKDQILTMYLNQVGYGGYAYGAEAASSMYFGKSAKDLTLAEAATLAAVTKSPTLLSPYGSGSERLIARRNIVLSRMTELGFITNEEAEQARSEKLVVKPREERILAPHFVMFVKEQLIQKYGEGTVNKGGLHVTTTLDLDKQRLAERVIAESAGHLTKSGAKNAGLVAINPKNGEIIALVGSRDYFDASNDGNVNVTLSPRPPGSAFKPIIYAAAFDKGPWAPGSTLYDLETDFGTDQLPYLPKNYDGKYHGLVSAREALANSFNVPAIKMMALVGKDDTINAAKELGITTFTDPNRYGLSLAIGGGSVRLLELTGAYGAFANGGVWYKPIAITKITQHGSVLFEHDASPKIVIRPQVAYQINSILSDTLARAPVFGTGGPLNVQGHTVAVKTGTSQDYRDALTIGYTPSWMVGVWVGNNDFSPMRQGAAGAMAAAPIWNQYMTKLLDGVQSEPFPVPSGLTVETVDAVTGLKPTVATRNTRQDIFASWQMPGDSNIQLVNYKIRDCHGTVKEEKFGMVVRSEKPDDPRWERPVQAWAHAHGYNGSSYQDQQEVCEEPPVEVASEEPPAVGGTEEEPAIAPTITLPTPKPIPPDFIEEIEDLPLTQIEEEEMDIPRNRRSRSRS